jgi:ketosteroid isomerase-like protein
MTNKKIFNTLIFVSALFLFDSCSKSESKSDANLEEAKQAIAASNDVYFQAFVKNDSSIFIDRYADDCCIMGPNAPAMCGANAPLEFFKMAYHDFGLRNGKFITQEVFGVGEDYVAEVGLWQSFDANNVLMDDGKFLVLWKKTPKGWKMFRDSFSSNRAIGGK